jgi:quinol monooxygenase YgiN
MTRFLLLTLLATACTDDADPQLYTARIRGPLAASVSDAKAHHDQVAMGGEPQTTAAGDFAHQVGLGTTNFGTPENEFLAIDQWDNLEGAQATYSNPDFQAALAPLFSAQPSVELYARHPDWKSWGEMGVGRGQPFWFVVVQGRLAKSDVAANHSAHDAIAGRGEDAARMGGDIAHLPHLSVTDDRIFFNVDVWSNEQGMLATFANPDFQAGLQSLFEAPPEVRIYKSTDWYQWYRP